jgi:hypothetical protein
MQALMAGRGPLISWKESARLGWAGERLEPLGDFVRFFFFAMEFYLCL